MTSVPSLLVAILSAWFAISVGRQYERSHRPNLFFWMCSLIFSCLASLGYSITLWTTPHAAFAFRAYYVLGAMWMPALMGLGSLGLVLGRKSMIVVSGLVSVLGVIGTVLLLGAKLSSTGLAALDGGAGDGVLQVGAWLLPLIILNTFGGAAVIIVALMSAWKRIRQRMHSRFFFGNLWLAVGILVISAAGSAARLGWPQVFWITMLVGWVITFIGYRMLTPMARHSEPLMSAESQIANPF